MEQFINQNENFEPSRASKYRWLRIRKNKMDFSLNDLNHFVVPSLFNVNDKYKRDRIIFFIAIILEFWGLGNILSLGQNSLMVLIGVPIAFLLDLVGAITAHWFEGKKCELKSKMFIADAIGDTNRYNAYEREKNGVPRILSIVGTFLIIITCLSKILVFVGLNANASSSGFDILAFGITFSYLLVAVVHIFFTGFFVAEFHFRFLLKRERNKHQDSIKDGTNHPDYTVLCVRDDYKFTSKVELNIANAGKQKLNLVSNDKGGFVYNFSTWGILQDDELSKIISKQKSENMKLVAHHGISFQHQILSAPIARIKD